MLYIIITVVLLIFMIIAALIGFLIHFWWFSADSENKAWIFIDIAGRLKQKKGILLTKTSEGETWSYGDKEIVIVPNDSKSFPIKYWKHRRKIDVLNGNLLASPIGNFESEAGIGKIQLIKDLTLSHIGSDMVKSMQGRGISLTMLIIIIVIVAVVVGGGVFFFDKQSQKAVQTESTPAVPSKILPPSGEVTP